MKLRNPQKSLFDLDAVASPTPRWHDGAGIDYLGISLRLQLDTDRRQAQREQDVLHLPLPPNASSRQIQDAAESWLRRKAEVLFSRLIANEIHCKVARLAHKMPKVTLSFSLRGSWTKLDGQVLRLNWRLIEQPLSVIELTLRRAVALLPVAQQTADFFSTSA
jgi:predicted metal-dependent hydrolase